MSRYTLSQEQLFQAAQYLRDNDRILRPIIDTIGRVELPLDRDYFSSLVSAIIAQQVSSRAAQTIEGRVRALFSPVSAFSPQGIVALGVDALRGVGVSGVKARYILDLAERVAGGSLNLEELPHMDDEEIVSRLLPVKGIGRWTAEMFLIFSLGRLDVLPVDDLGLRTGVMRAYGLQHLPKRPDLIDLAEPWRPFRTVATLYMWRSIGDAARDAAETHRVHEDEASV